VTSIAEVGSTEEVALFNPAFLARLLNATANDYAVGAKRGMPAAFAFLAIPLVLHKPTRDDLPTNAASQMQTWIREHPRHIVRLDARVVGLRPFVGLAIRFGVQHGVLTSVDGTINAGNVKRRPPGFAERETPEVGACFRAANFLGRWFARQPDTATLLALWGLRP
jgi:hypothetical protein